MQRTRHRAMSLMKALAATAISWVAAASALASDAPAGSASGNDSKPFGLPAPAGSGAETQAIPFSVFIADVQQGKVVTVTISGDTLRGRLQTGAPFTSVLPTSDAGITIQTLLRNKVRIDVEHPLEWAQIVNSAFFGITILSVIGAFFYLRQGRLKDKGGGAVAKGFCSAHARRLAPDEVKTTFGDVAGVEESKQELAEIVEFLRDPGKFERLGGKIPKGILMVGSPGTGKTLLARAVAGEAKVPFFSISGSDFVEMFVGVGASRVRDLFEQAKMQAPCIVFIDEIDAVGRHRTASGGGGHEEREQTLNQLLVEMDGFDSNKGIIVVAATNRADVLDAALLRPGRFDRQVVVPLPDARGREEILRVHMRQVRLAGDVDPTLIARGTPGFSGADLANLVNEAALFAARADGVAVGMKEFERARDKIMIGGERRSMALSEQDRKVTAYHEAGHAIVGLNVPDHDPVYKVSILPRGRALGITAYLPEADRCSQTKESLNSRICALLGGRLAEELIFGTRGITTGAANDIKCATEIARRMVTQYGMSEELGPLDYCGDEESGAGSRYSASLASDTARTIDRAVRGIVEHNYNLARQILEANIQAVHRLAAALIRYETLDRAQIQDILQAHNLDQAARADSI